LLQHDLASSIATIHLVRRIRTAVVPGNTNGSRSSLSSKVVKRGRRRVQLDNQAGNLNLEISQLVTCAPVSERNVRQSLSCHAGERGHQQSQVRALSGRGIASADFDDAMIETRPLRVPLADDGLTHRLRVRLG
jgi:hypothetical protein